MFMAGISGIIPGANSTAVGAPSGTDPYWTSVVLLAGMNGSNGSTTVPDESPANHGNATISGLNNDVHLNTTVKKFGSASAQFDGNNEAVKWPDHADWSFGSADFTVEGWFYFESTAEANRPLVNHWDGSSSQREWTLAYRGDLATNVLQFSASNAGTAADFTLNSSAWTPTLSTWYHIAVDRSGNVFRIYVDGVMVGTATNSITMFNSSYTINVGVQDTTYHFGYIDEVRITKGVARYASDSGYPVPTAAFPRS